jgi:hypothetical protein
LIAVIIIVKLIIHFQHDVGSESFSIQQPSLKLLKSLSIDAGLLRQSEGHREKAQIKLRVSNAIKQYALKLVMDDIWNKGRRSGITVFAVSQLFFDHFI